MTIDLFANVLNNDVIDNLTPSQVDTINAMFEKPAPLDFSSLPVPTETRVRSGKYGPYGQTHRDVDTRWVLNPDDDERVRVTLSTSHRAERKQFATTLTWGTVRSAEPGSAFQVETWASDHAYVTVLVAPCARYSEKGMREHHATALALLAECFDPEIGDRRVPAVFEEAARNIGVTERY
jgi:hypothetical protein